MANLTAFDVVVLLLIGLGGLAGLARGFITEVLSLLAWVAAILAVRFLYPTGKALAFHLTGTASGAAILAFVVIFLVAFVGFRLIAQMLGDRTRASVVGPVDRLLGLGFGAFKGLIGASVLYLLLQFGYDTVEAGAPRPAWLRAARTAPLLDVSSKAMVDFVEKRRHPAGAAPGSASDRGAAGSASDRGGAKGYSPGDRGALDRLLDTSDKTPV